MQSRPLPDTNPELLIFDSPGVREYRVENWHLSRAGNGDVVRAAHNLGWQDLLILVAFLYFEVINMLGYVEVQHGDLCRCKADFGLPVYSECC
jgi:hypothetical protein